MLGSFDVVATVATRDLAAARRFYEGALHLTVAEDIGDGGVVLRSGATTLLLYVSTYAGTNQATAATWEVGDQLEPIVRELAASGVRFEHYDDLRDTRREGDIHFAGEMKLAWLKDPDGNILALNGR